MADSEMKRFPEAWMVDSNKKPRWGYTQGLEALAFQQLWLATGDQKYYDYQKGYADSLIAADGTIKTYQKTEYNWIRSIQEKFFSIYTSRPATRAIKPLSIRCAISCLHTRGRPMAGSGTSTNIPIRCGSMAFTWPIRF
jgi:rhamnogalacturonyl hydrolase YesR